MLSSRAIRRKQLRKWARRSKVSRLRHLFMASVAHDFKIALYNWATESILEQQQKILYGESPLSKPLGVIRAHQNGGGENEKSGVVDGD